MIETQTFEFNRASEDELLIISKALWLMGEGNYEEAKRVLIMRHDQLTAAPKLKRYDQREAAA